MDKNKHIKKVLQELPLDKAPINFTNKVMGDIDMFSNEELLRDKNLTNLLKENIIEEPSLDFVSNIMTSVESKTELVYEPVISKKAWFVIITFFVGIVIYVFNINSPSNSSSIMSKASPYLDKVQSMFNGFTFSFELSPTLVIGLLSLCTLLIIDFVSRQRNLA